MTEGLAGGEAPKMDGGREATDGYVLAVSGVGLMTVVEDGSDELESSGGRGSEMEEEARDVGGYMLGERAAFVCGISRWRFTGFLDPFFMWVGVMDSNFSDGIGGRVRCDRELKRLLIRGNGIGIGLSIDLTCEGEDEMLVWTTLVILSPPSGKIASLEYMR